MDSVDVRAAISTGDDKQFVNKKNRDWHRRLHLRKTAVRGSTMQVQDKHGPKKIAKEWEQNTPWPSTRRSPHKTQSSHGTNDSENILRFRCCQCKDNLEFVPKDLVRHFKDVHRGSPPVFPCHLCNFSTHDLSLIQVHLLNHIDTFSNCIICNDNVQRTFSEFSAHLTMQHSQNGNYSCERCKTFSTGDVKTFLEHIYQHKPTLERGNETDYSVPTKKDFKKPFGSKTTTRKFQCEDCGFEASQKRLLTKHMNTVHGGQNGKQDTKMAHSITVKPNDPIPEMRHRLTRNTVREMYWPSEDCLSLSGREFLGKYCSLSNSERTLEETQQFLVKSTAGEMDGQKWTKALQTVLANVPQDMNLHPKSENGTILNSGYPNSSKDLTVLTVKKKITVPQNGTTFPKRCKITVPFEKEEHIPSENATVETHCVLDPSRNLSDLNDQAHCQGSQNALINDNVSISAQIEPAECSQVQENGENRENQELRVDRDTDECRRKYEELKNLNLCEDGVDGSKDLRLASERDDLTSISKAPLRNRSRKRRWRRKTRPKVTDSTLLETAGLKLVLKKDPEKDKLWMSQSPISPLDCSLQGEHHIPSQPLTALEGTHNLPQRTQSAENSQEKWTKDPETDQHNAAKAVTSKSESKSGDEFSPGFCEHLGTSHNDFSSEVTKNKPSVPFNLTVDGNEAVGLKIIPSANQEIHDKTERSVEFTETVVDNSSPAGKASQSNSVSPSTASSSRPENVLLQNTVSNGASEENDISLDCQVSDGVDSPVLNDITLHNNCGPKFSVLQPVITPKGNNPSEESGLAVSSVVQGDLVIQGKRKREPSIDHCVELLSEASGSCSQSLPEEPSPATVYHQHLAPRNMERTLKLVAQSPTQLIKRPLRDQPVVVLNHPDADIPEVMNIMEVIHRYRGEIQKVVLSHKTLKALLGMDGDMTLGESRPKNIRAPSPGRMCPETSVKERFILKLKLRRIGRKKYQVVSAVSPSSDLLIKFHCWFCGRMFENKFIWMSHQKQHLMEWDRPKL